MNWKTILVHLDDSERCAERIALAASLAQRHGAHLVGLAPTGLPDVLLTLNAAVPDAVEVIALPAHELRELAQARAADFERRMRAAGIASHEARVVEAEPLDALADIGRWADLVVLGQTDRSAELPGVAWDLPQQVTLHTGGPVLVVPWAGHFESIGRDVLVAWKDTRECARALRDAAPLLASARRVVLLELVAPGAPASGGLAEAAAHLARLGEHAETRREPTEVEAGDALLSRVSDLGADALVMGAYGHSRLREWVLGGATRHVLAHMTVPTLFSH